MGKGTLLEGALADALGPNRRRYPDRSLGKTADIWTRGRGDIRGRERIGWRSFRETPFSVGEGQATEGYVSDAGIGRRTFRCKPGESLESNDLGEQRRDDLGILHFFAGPREVAEAAAYFLQEPF